MNSSVCHDVPPLSRAPACRRPHFCNIRRVDPPAAAVSATERHPRNGDDVKSEIRLQINALNDHPGFLRLGAFSANFSRNNVWIVLTSTQSGCARAPFGLRKPDLL
jgi:hypothetical protein